ncbi:MAG: ABC transporter permease [Anaerolineae bacterium]|nr:ABC transporter permease [Anaerolineae bacterium]
MNPLSPFTYYCRHKRRALMLAGLLALAVTGIYLLVGLMQETFVTPPRTINQYLSKFSLVQSDRASTPDPAVTAQIRAHPDVAQALPQSSLEIAVPNAGGVSTPFRLIGLYEADVATVLAHSGVTLIEGHLPQPRTNGVALSWEAAMALDLEIGDTFDWSKDEYAYPSIVTPLELVGILSGDVRLGIVSYEYLEGHERYRDIANYGVLVIAYPGREAAVDNFLTQAIRNSRTDVYTHQLLLEEVTRNQMLLMMTFSPIVLLVTAAITLVIGTVNRLAFLQRLPEFGTLHAVGRGKRWLARRLAIETAGLAVAGWTLGILVSFGGMAAMSAAFYAPQGYGFDPIQGSALVLVAPLPLAVVGSTIFTATRTLGRMDAVAIVERGELSLEKARSGHTGRGKAGRLPRPLASATFYRRHTSQAAVLVGTMALMIVGTALFVFILEASTDVMLQPPLTPLEPMSLVSQKGVPLDTAVIAQIRAHPGAKRTIPVYVFTPLEIAIPPMMIDYPVQAYGVTAEDLAYLVELYGLKLAEGDLPHPNTNEIVIPWTVAKNRDIQVGDVIGNRDHPIYPGAPKLPSELVVSGIFAPDEGSWLSFSSLEFVNAYQDYWKSDLSLIVVPKAGQRAALDGWLENEIDGERRTVFTYGKQEAWWQDAANTLLFTTSLMESVVALVAALALVGLNYVFLAQRQAEFGVLSALGFTRPQLVWRVVRESLLTTGAAWLVGLLGCGAIVLYMQQAVYAPVGLGIDFFNPIPWLYTLPVPVAVLAVSAGAVAWALARLDPVAVIERR